MSSQEVRRVLNQLLTDEVFREQFGTDSTMAIAGFQLTDAEKAMLGSLDINTVEASDLVVAHQMEQSAIRVGALYLT